MKKTTESDSNYDTDNEDDAVDKDGVVFKVQEDPAMLGNETKSEYV